MLLAKFSSDLDRKSVNVLNIGRSTIIERAPIKSQCARSYFYGEDLVLETKLQSTEGRYAEIVRGIISQRTCGEAEFAFLRRFSYLQYLRTDYAMRRSLLMQEDMRRLAFEKNEDHPENVPFTHIEGVRQTFSIFAETMSLVDDLKSRLVINMTGLPFCTSDDPSVQINRFYKQQSSRFSASGIKSAGLIFVLPLNPEIAFVSYDPGVYSTDAIGRDRIEVRKVRDVEALNELQFLKASKNVYFSDATYSSQLLLSLERTRANRPTSWYDIHYAVLDRASEHGKRYKVVHTEAERLQATEALIHVQNKPLMPSTWFSPLRFRRDPRYIDTRSGSGFIRRRFKDDLDT